MKTLIFNGSPRRKGDTAQLVELLQEKLEGEVQVVDCYYANIAPCIDCRYCWKKPGCAVKDDMQGVYALVEEADNIVIASPIHFSEITGPLLCVAGRFQTYFSAKSLRKETPFQKEKRGGVIIVGGGNGDLSVPFGTARRILRLLNVKGDIPQVLSFDTDNVPALEDPSAMDAMEALADYLIPHPGADPE